MTALHSAVTQTRTTPNFLALVVEPIGTFVPANWQAIPGAYRIVSFVGHKKHRGDADAWKFLFNREAIKEAGRQGKQVPNQWAIWVS